MDPKTALLQRPMHREARGRGGTKRARTAAGLRGRPSLHSDAAETAQLGDCKRTLDCECDGRSPVAQLSVAQATVLALGYRTSSRAVSSGYRLRSGKDAALNVSNIAAATTVALHNDSPSIISYSDSSSPLPFFFPAPPLLASLPRLLPSPARGRLCGGRCFTADASLVALPSNCDPSLVAALLELLPEGSQIAPHIGALSAPARSCVIRSQALPLIFPSSRYHPISVEGVAGKAPEF